MKRLLWDVFSQDDASIFVDAKRSKFGIDYTLLEINKYNIIITLLETIDLRWK